MIRKSDCLGCAVLLCFVDLACFFLSSFLLISRLKTCIIIRACVAMLCRCDSGDSSDSGSGGELSHCDCA